MKEITDEDLIQLQKSLRTLDENYNCFKRRLIEMCDDFFMPQSLKNDLLETMKFWEKRNLNNK